MSLQSPATPGFATPGTGGPGGPTGGHDLGEGSRSESPDLSELPMQPTSNILPLGSGDPGKDGSVAWPSLTPTSGRTVG
jgi:hypothetical protein